MPCGKVRNGGLESEEMVEMIRAYLSNSSKGGGEGNDIENRDAQRCGDRISNFKWKVELPRKLETVYGKRCPPLYHEGK